MAAVQLKYELSRPLHSTLPIYLCLYLIRSTLPVIVAGWLVVDTKPIWWMSRRPGLHTSLTTIMWKSTWRLTAVGRRAVVSLIGWVDTWQCELRLDWLIDFWLLFNWPFSPYFSGLGRWLSGGKEGILTELPFIIICTRVVCTFIQADVTDQPDLCFIMFSFLQ